MALAVESAREGKVVVLKLAGSLDASSVDKLSNTIREQATANNPPLVVLAMDSLDFISSAGWSVLVESSRSLQEMHGDLRLTNMRDTAQRIFKLMGLEICLRQYGSVNEAVKSYAE